MIYLLQLLSECSVMFFIFIYVVPVAEWQHSSFECPEKYFKCPMSYCIPWRYTCDGIYHCSDGMDEHKNLCPRTSGPGQLICNTSAMCVGIANLCDNIIDCPLGDDELLCIQQVPYCPINCSCLFLMR